MRPLPLQPHSCCFIALKMAVAILLTWYHHDIAEQDFIWTKDTPRRVKTASRPC
jgi:hypothetical protein